MEDYNKLQEVPGNQGSAPVTPQRNDGGTVSSANGVPSFGGTYERQSAAPSSGNDAMPSLSPEFDTGASNSDVSDDTPLQALAPNVPAAGVTPPNAEGNTAFGTPAPASAPETSADAHPTQPARTVTGAAEATPKAKRHTPTAAVLVAVLVIAALVGLAMFVYLESQTQEQPAVNTPTSTTAEPEAVTPADVDEATEAIDEELESVDDNQDFNESDLSDGTLSL